MIVRNADTMPGTYVWYVAAVLTLANSFAFVDRQVLALLMQPIKADLHISLLYGLCLSLLQVLIEVEMVRLANRSNRRNIIIGSIVVCSFMTMLCRLARSAGLLFLARVGVGAGEAGLNYGLIMLLAGTAGKLEVCIAVALRRHSASLTRLEAAEWLEIGHR